MKNNESGNIFLYLLIIISILGGVGYYLNSTHSPYPTLSPSSANSVVSLFTKYPGTYRILINKDESYDLFYKGKVLSIVARDGLFNVNLEILQGPSQGKTQVIIFPNSPPLKYASKIGNNIKEVVDHGFKLLNVRLRYDKNNKFLEWELI